MSQQLKMLNAAVKAGAPLSSAQRSALGRAFADTRPILRRTRPRIVVSDYMARSQTRKGGAGGLVVAKDVGAAIIQSGRVMLVLNELKCRSPDRTACS